MHYRPRALHFPFREVHWVSAFALGSHNQPHGVSSCRRPMMCFALLDIHFHFYRFSTFWCSSTQSVKFPDILLRWWPWQSHIFVLDSIVTLEKQKCCEVLAQSIGSLQFLLYNLLLILFPFSFSILQAQKVILTVYAYLQVFCCFIYAAFQAFTQLWSHYIQKCEILVHRLSPDSNQLQTSIQVPSQTISHSFLECS